MSKGIHHITAIASDAQENVDFYTKVLGLRLVKKSVNQDDTSTYHLFFGDEFGEPGMDLTFFIFLPAQAGHTGVGLVSKISLAVPQDSLDFWHDRLTQLHVPLQPKQRQFDHDRFTFFDPDRQELELVGIDLTHLTETHPVWQTAEVSAQHAIRQFHSVTLSVHDIRSIEPVLTQVLGYTQIAQDDHRYLFQSQKGTGRAELLEVLELPTTAPGIQAAGTVHHIAFRADDAQHQLQLRQKVIELGLFPTEVINRFYFQSVYFRTRAGILFEIATDGPGFTADEPAETLGTHLALPPFLEAERSLIEANLIPLNYDSKL